MCLKHKFETYRRLERMSTHNCFGCGPANPSGLQMKFYTDETSLFSRLTVPDHLCGWDRMVHGGVISTVLDEIMSWSAITLLKRIILTKSMAVDFLKPVFVGTELCVEGKLLSHNSEREALMAGFLYDHNGELCARSQGTFALFTPAAALRMRIMSEADVRGFEAQFDA